MLLFVLAAALTLAVIAVLLRPLLRDMAAPGGPQRFNIAVYRDQLDELQRDVAAGRIPEADAAAARNEIERRLLTASRGEDGAAPLLPAPRTAALTLAAVLAVAAGGLYLALGNPAQPDKPLPRAVPPATAQAAGGGGGGDSAHADLDRLVSLLARRLEQKPDDANGWALLARSLLQLDRKQEAVRAYRQAVATSGGAPEIVGEYAEARISADDGVVDAEAEGLFRRLLAAEAGNARARYYLALAKAQRGDMAAALADWRALLASAPPGAPWRSAVEGKIAQAQGAAAAPPTAPSASPASSIGPTGADVAAADAMSPGDRQAMIDGMVQRLADRLKANPDDLEGWRRLAQAYRVLNRPADAARAEAQVSRLEKKGP